MLLRAGVAEAHRPARRSPPSTSNNTDRVTQRRHLQPRKGVNRRELHICVLRRDGLRVPHAASDDDKSRKNFQSFLKFTL